MRVMFKLRLIASMVLIIAVLVVYAHQEEIGAWMTEQINLWVESQLQQLLG